MGSTTVQPAALEDVKCYLNMVHYKHFRNRISQLPAWELGDEFLLPLPGRRIILGAKHGSSDM